MKSRNPSRFLSICHQTNIQETIPCKSLQVGQSCDKGVSFSSAFRVYRRPATGRNARGQQHEDASPFPPNKEPEARGMLARNRRATLTVIQNMQPPDYVVQLTSFQVANGDSVGVWTKASVFALDRRSKSPLKSGLPGLCSLYRGVSPLPSSCCAQD